MLKSENHSFQSDFWLFMSVHFYRFREEIWDGLEIDFE